MVKKKSKKKMVDPFMMILVILVVIAIAAITGTEVSQHQEQKVADIQDSIDEVYVQNPVEEPRIVMNEFSDANEIIDSIENMIP